MKSQLKGGNFSEGARCAERARTAPANTLKNPPPPGPKPEPVRINGVPKVGGDGIK